MNDKTRNVIMIGASVYIGYLGFTLFTGFINGETSSPFMLVAGILFVAFAIFTSIFYIRQLLRPEEPSDEEEEILEKLSDECSSDEEEEGVPKGIIEKLSDDGEDEATTEEVEEDASSSEGEEACE